MTNWAVIVIILLTLLILIIFIVLFPTIMIFLPARNTSSTNIDTNTTTNTTSPEYLEEMPRDVIIIVKRPLEEWKQMYLQYLNITYYQDIYIYNLSLDAPEEIYFHDLIEIIKNADNDTYVLELNGYDPNNKRVDNIHVKVYIPMFVLRILNDIKLGDAPPALDPVMYSIGQAIRFYVYNTASPKWNYTDYRITHIICTIVENRMEYGRRAWIHPLILLIDGYGVCRHQTIVANSLLSASGLWSADIVIPNISHVRTGVHVEKFPPNVNPPNPYIVTFKLNNETYNITFYACDVTWRTGFIDKELNSEVSTIYLPVDQFIEELKKHGIIVDYPELEPIIKIQIIQPP
ncbi:hypothetical protein [Staphylothermus hellenicus]|uniref:Uncharacterized protein n=1 Tax=Staphylothermus hellenicus (strain DSM 12710 / JCM 10830 / BK20S6-10-b1 / P8) TaxID=591019 RepID=D7D833_STAHD|nr:hypothetical protein [Staphylothermus hellenicus]ADI31929.1 hypothetical protein Shell_0816 [Staphylothermus hellenicus DSM 12710]